MVAKFEKKLVILQGLHDSTRATVTIESNNYGISCQISAVLDDLMEGQYLCAVRTSDDAQIFLLGMNGRINTRFELNSNMASSDAIHCIIFLRQGDEDKPKLYGTNGSKKLWEGNMMDGITKRETKINDTYDKYNNGEECINTDEIIKDNNNDSVTSTTLNPKDNIDDNINNKSDDPLYDEKEIYDDMPYSEFDKVMELLDSSKYRDNAIASINYYDLEKEYQELKSNNIRDIKVTKNSDNNISNEVASVVEKNDNIEKKQNVDDYVKKVVNNTTPLEQKPYNNASNINQVDNKPHKYEQDFIANRKILSNQQLGVVGSINNYNSTTQNMKVSYNTNTDMPNINELVKHAKKTYEYNKYNNSINNIDDYVDSLKHNSEAMLNSDTKHVSTSGYNFQNYQHQLYNDHSANNISTINNNSTNGVFNKSFGAKINTFNSGINPTINSKDGIVVPGINNSSSIITQTASKTKPLTFFDKISEQINKLFETYPAEVKLNKMLPDTKWIKVDYDNNGRYYCIGLIGLKPDYICYAVPSVYTEEPPKELDGYCQWIPLDELKPKANGYWLLYQDAITGESVAN